MKTISKALIISGLILASTISVRAQSRIAGAEFEVAGTLTILSPDYHVDISGHAKFDSFSLSGAYWDDIFLTGTPCGIIAVQGAPYFEVQLDEASSLIVAFRIGSSGCFRPNITLFVDLFYVWRDGFRLRFVCFPNLLNDEHGWSSLGYITGIESYE